jgi:hypothetical protein
MPTPGLENLPLPNLVPQVVTCACMVAPVANVFTWRCRLWTWNALVVGLDLVDCPLNVLASLLFADVDWYESFAKREQESVN